MRQLILKALQPNDMPLAPSLSPTSSHLCQLVCFCLSVQVFTLAGGFSALSLPSKSSNLQNLFLSPHKGSYVLLCVMLVTRSRLCAGSLQTSLRHTPTKRAHTHIPPLPLQTAIMCLSAAQHGGGWGRFSIPPAIYVTFSWLQVEERGKARGSDAHDGWKARAPAGPPKQLFSGSISHTVMERVHPVCLWHCVHVFDEVPDTSLFCSEERFKDRNIVRHKYLSEHHFSRFKFSINYLNNFPGFWHTYVSFSRPVTLKLLTFSEISSNVFIFFKVQMEK